MKVVLLLLTMFLAIACDTDRQKENTREKTELKVSQGNTIYIDKARYNKTLDNYYKSSVKIIDWKGHDIVLLGQQSRGYSFHDPECKKCKGSK
jgi:hypothetical protein